MAKNKIIASLALIFYVILNVNLVRSQEPICRQSDIIPDPLNLPIPTFDQNAQILANVEINDATSGITTELIEYYDGKNNVGLAETVYDNTRILTYSYYDIDELLIVNADSGQCKKYTIAGSVGFGPFDVVIDPTTGKERILSPLNALLTSTLLNYVYTGSNQFIRGIPVNIWQACYQDKATGSSYKITAAFTDPNKWTVALLNKPYTSVPVQIKFEKKEIKAGVESVSVTFNEVTNFRPFTQLDEEAYVTPPGVYCPDRVSLKKFPEIPQSISFRAESVSRTTKAIFNVRENYDYYHKLARIDTINGRSYSSLISDFTTGIVYNIDFLTGICKPKLIDASDRHAYYDGTYIQMKNTSDAFSLGVSHQYIGMKRRNGVNTDVWVSYDKVDAGVELFTEWYFSAESWTIQGRNFTAPIEMKTYQKNPGSTDYITSHLSIFEYRERYNNLLGFDISLCETETDYQAFVFTVPRSYGRLIRSNENSFIVGTAEALSKIADITLLRLFEIEIDFRGSDEKILIHFKVHREPSEYGNVPKPVDLPLAEATRKINQYFANNELEINFYSENNGVFTVATVKADKNGLIEVDAQGLIFYNIEEVKQGYSGGAVAAATIIFTLMGLMFAVLLTVLHKYGKIRIPII